MPQQLLPLSLPAACSLEISTYILPGKGRPRSQVGLIHMALNMSSSSTERPICCKRRSGELGHPELSSDTFPKHLPQ